MLNLKEKLDKSEVRALLAHAVGTPTPEKLQQVAQRYADCEALVLVGVMKAEMVIGCIGLDLTHSPKAIITHLAVLPEARGNGIGRRMLTSAIQHFSLTALVAETDSSASGFYQCCGFTVSSLGEKYPGVERFLCKYGE